MEQRVVRCLRVVGAELDGHDIGIAGQCLLEAEPFSILHVGAIGAVHECVAREAEVLDEVAIAKQFLQASGISFGLLVLEAMAFGDGIAHTGHANGVMAKETMTWSLTRTDLLCSNWN